MKEGDHLVKVSVIIAAYNCENVVGEAIEAILNQTYEDWELIICDDASTDNTPTVLEKYAQLDNRITVLRNPENKKAAYSRNVVLRLQKENTLPLKMRMIGQCLRDWKNK